MNLDYYIFYQVNQFAGKNICLDSTAIFFAEYFQYIVAFLLLLFLVKNPAPERSSVLDQSRTETNFLVRGFRRYLKMVIFALSAAIFARFVIVEIIRYFLPRLRPFVENHINLLVAYNPNEASFPSGHAAFFFALATVVYFYNKKVGIFFFLASFLISLARVFVGIHWPLDILAGALVGIFIGWLTNKIIKKF